MYCSELNQSYNKYNLVPRVSHLPIPRGKRGAGRLSETLGTRLQQVMHLGWKSKILFVLGRSTEYSH